MSTSSKVMLDIPVEMRTHSGSYQSRLIVGPFKNEARAKEWEEDLVQAIVNSSNDEALGYVEARTVYGRGIRALTGKNCAEVSVAPPGKNPMQPDKHFIVDEGTIEPCRDVQTIPTINASKVSGFEVGHNLGYYIAHVLRMS